MLISSAISPMHHKEPCGGKAWEAGVGGNRQQEKHAGKGNRLCQGFQGAWPHHGRKQCSRVRGNVLEGKMVTAL